jgi:CubicO group peptidase (beta-lactamase class C family)
MGVAIGVLCLALMTMGSLACSGSPSNEARASAVETSLPEIQIDQTVGPEWHRIGHIPGTSHIHHRMEHYRVPGVGMAVVDGFRVVWAREYGVLEAGGEDSVTTATRFEAASTTKATVAAAVLSLVGRGDLDLDEDVNRRLTSWRVPESAVTTDQRVTIRRLLSHTAGINRPPGGFAIAKEGSPTTVQVLRGEPPALNAPLSVERVPGSGHQYSNFGYIVLQQLLEDVTGRPFAQAMRELVFEPLGMASSTFDHDTAMREGIPKPHGGDGAPLESSPHPSALAQGGLWTTPTDLALLAVEIMENHRGGGTGLLSREVAELALAPEVEIDPLQSLGFTGQGLGVFLLSTDRGPGFCHPGFNEPGATCMFLGFPQTGQGAVIMTNGARGLELSFEILSSIAAEYSWPRIQTGPND